MLVKNLTPLPQAHQHLQQLVILACGLFHAILVRAGLIKSPVVVAAPPPKGDLDRRTLAERRYQKDRETHLEPLGNAKADRALDTEQSLFPTLR